MQSKSQNINTQTYVFDDKPSGKETSCQDLVGSPYHHIGTIVSPVAYETTRVTQWS